MSDIDERLEEEILHAFRKSFDSQQAGINANFLMELQSEIERLRSDLATVTAERDRMSEALRPFDDFPLHKWDGIGDDHVLYGPFTLGHVRKYLSGSCQAILDNSNYLEKPDSCARAALEGVTEPASPWRDIKSAPKDGTLIQVWRKNRNVVTAYWIKNQSCWKNPNIEIPALYDPTHWMPLPEPPR